VSDSTQHTLAAMAALLDQGHLVHGLSRVLTLAGLLAGPVALILGHKLSPAACGVALLVALVGLAETWFAVRVGIDAKLMRHLAEVAAAGPLDLAAFDEGMRRAGLVKAPTPGRDLDDRMTGAWRLLSRQAAFFALQVLLVLAGGAMIGAGA